MTIPTPDLPAETLDHESLFRRLSGGLTLVTANSRLARVLTGQYSHWRIAQGDGQWQSPAILSWDAWLDGLWEAAALQGIEGSGRAVPGSQQLLSLWESVLREDPHAQKLLRPESLASRLRDTRKLLVAWRLDPNHPTWRGEENENYAAFHRWNRSFESLCQRKQWIAPEDRSAILGQAVREARFVLSAHVALLGFDEFNPAQIELLAALIEAGNSVGQMTIAAAEPGAALWQSIGSEDELRKMARWVRYWFEKEPDSRIAIVVPNLLARRQEVERHLDEILTPGNEGASGGARPWNISMGKPLARYQMIESAFDLLRLLDKRIDIQDIGRVLRSPWVRGDVAERNSRALLEKCLRDKYPRQVKLSEVWYRAGEIRKYDRHHEKLPPDQREARAWNSPVLVSVIDTLARFERDNRSAREPSAWAEAFDRLLSKLGWPLGNAAETNAGAPEHSENWQTFQAWRDALRELATLDATLPRLGRKAAINQLHRVCRERVFQPRTAPARIQVLGLYEASGLRFDHLWVLGLHNGNWPPGAQPNPFIPGPLQQAAQIPQSSPQRELEVARAITLRLLETADDCVFSYPGRLDGDPILPSPLLQGEHFQLVDDVPGWAGDTWQAAVYGGEKPRIDPLLMPRPLERYTARGGSSILRHQALCPFRAFASNRLGADGLETPVDGISPMLHGSLLHRVLENFWRETRTQQALLLLDEGSLGKRIRKHVDDVINGERSLKNRRQFRDVEGERLARLTASSLELEKARDPFEVIAFEQEILQEIEGQVIRLIIDRVDRLPCGDEVIIDYKSGKVEPKKWFGNRPEDPQLPLYSISAEIRPAAIAFAVIRDDECLYKGVATQEGIFPGLPPKRNHHNADIIEAGLDMPATVQNWREILHRLMAEFLAGDARIDPKDGRKTCDNSYCEMQSFCRISELEQVNP
jgi:ATP-dependent helicase/nuclease subunit B